jgi:hypothetical protein
VRNRVCSTANAATKRHKSQHQESACHEKLTMRPR